MTEKRIDRLTWISIFADFKIREVAQLQGQGSRGCSGHYVENLKRYATDSVAVVVEV
jgi:hypothetical protein